MRHAGTVYFDMHGVRIIAGMKICCTINGEIEQVHADDDGELGILGAELDDLPPTVHPLTSFDGSETPTGYALSDFEIAEIQEAVMGLAGGIISGFVLAAIVTVFVILRGNAELKRCLVEEETPEIETFTYKGKAYKKENYINIRVSHLINLKRKDLDDMLDKAYKEQKKHPDNPLNDIEVVAINRARVQK